MVWQRVTYVMLFCILSFGCKISVKLILPGAYVT